MARALRAGWLPVVLWLAAASPAAAFVVKDIELQGLQRLEAATVFTYLPLEVGEEFDDERSSEVLRALFKTQLFSDVTLSRRGDVLVIRVVERPAITEIDFTGLDIIKDEDLQEVLEEAGIATGRIFNQQLLDRLHREILQQYHAVGRYNAEVDVAVEELGENRVRIDIRVAEGEAASIRQVHLIGNLSYTEEELLDLFESEPPAWYDFLTDSGQYSKLTLSGDLERLQTFYLNRGFLKFRVESAQISLSPDREGIYITVHLSEGRRFVVREVTLSGLFVVAQAELVRGMTIRAGEYFSNARMQDTSAQLTERLGEDGYAFAKVNPITELDEERGEVAINFFIDPGQRVYVRRIEIVGNDSTQDEVLRRELRQIEGGWLSPPLLERSRRRLQRLEYIESAEIEQLRVPGTADQVDLKVTVTERLAGNFSIGAGFSSGSGLTLATGVEQENFLGSGNRVGFHFNNSDTARRYSFDFHNPYYTINGVSRGFGISTRRVDTSDNNNLTEYKSRDFLVYLSYGIPISDESFFSFTTRVQRINLDSSAASTPEVFAFLRDHDGQCRAAAAGGEPTFCEASYNNLALAGAFRFDTRDRSLFTRDGSLREVSAQMTVPFSDLTYYTLGYRQEEHFRLTDDVSFSVMGELAYGSDYGDTADLPFFEKFVTGGPRSVRGYKVNTLAPRDAIGRPFGGNFKAGYSTEVTFPVPYVTEANLRGAVFFDSGYVFEEFDDFELGDMRASVGIGFSWLSPLGGVSMSVSAPINRQTGDKTESFQFNLGIL